MAAREKTETNNYSGCGIFHHGVDDVSYHSNINNCAENMGPLQHITDLEGKFLKLS